MRRSAQRPLRPATSPTFPAAMGIDATTGFPIHRRPVVASCNPLMRPGLAGRAPMENLMGEFPKKVITVHWICARGHKHRKQANAEACGAHIKAKREAIRCKEEKAAAKEREFYSVDIPRMRMAFLLKERGCSHSEIGKAIGRKDDPSQPLSSSGVAYLCARYTNVMRRFRWRAEFNGDTRAARELYAEQLMRANDLQADIARRT